MLHTDVSDLAALPEGGDRSSLNGSRFQFEGFVLVQVFTNRVTKMANFRVVPDNRSDGRLVNADIFRRLAFRDSDDVLYFCEPFMMAPDAFASPEVLAEMARVVDPEQRYAAGTEEHRLLKNLFDALSRMAYAQFKARVGAPGAVTLETATEEIVGLGLKEDQAELALELFGDSTFSMRELWQAVTSVC